MTTVQESIIITTAIQRISTPTAFARMMHKNIIAAKKVAEYPAPTGTLTSLQQQQLKKRKNKRMIA